MPSAPPKSNNLRRVSNLFFFKYNFCHFHAPICAWLFCVSFALSACGVVCASIFVVVEVAPVFVALSQRAKSIKNYVASLRLNGSMRYSAPCSCIAFNVQHIYTFLRGVRFSHTKLRHSSIEIERCAKLLILLLVVNRVLTAIGEWWGDICRIMVCGNI